MKSPSCSIHFPLVALGERRQPVGRCTHACFRESKSPLQIRISAARRGECTKRDVRRLHGRRESPAPCRETVSRSERARESLVRKNDGCTRHDATYLCAAPIINAPFAGSILRGNRCSERLRRSRTRDGTAPVRCDERGSPSTLVGGAHGSSGRKHSGAVSGRVTGWRPRCSCSSSALHLRTILSLVTR